MAQISFGLSGGFWPTSLPFVPRLAGLVGFHVGLPRRGWESDSVADWRMAAFRHPA